MRFIFFAEPISPRFISFWLRRRLGNWKQEGLIDDYRVKTRRLGKFHFTVQVDLELRQKQVDWIGSDVLTRIFRRRGGEVNE